MIMEDIEVRRERRQENEKMERSSWRYVFGRWIFKISSVTLLIHYLLFSVIHLFGIPNIFDLDEIYWEMGEVNLSINFVKWGLILFMLSIFTIRFWILRGKNTLLSGVSSGHIPKYPDRETEKLKRTISLNVSFYLLIFQSLGIFFNPVNWETSINPLTNNSSIFPYYVIHILFLLYFLIFHIVVSNIKVNSDE